MDKKVLCPYCGSEMIGQNVTQVFGVYWAQAKCEHCKSTGPLICGERGLVTDAEEMARKSALSAAQARYLPPNRPLTLDEVKALETDNWMCTPAWVEFADCKKTIESGQIRLAPNVLESYGRDFRVWLRKPTQAEMDAAGWGDAYEPATND